MKSNPVLIVIFSIVYITVDGSDAISGEQSMQSSVCTSDNGTALYNEIVLCISGILQRYGYDLRDERIDYDYSRFVTNRENRYYYPDEIFTEDGTTRIGIMPHSRSCGRTSIHDTLPDRSIVSLIIDDTIITFF